MKEFIELKCRCEKGQMLVNNVKDVQSKMDKLIDIKHSAKSCSVVLRDIRGSNMVVEVYDNTKSIVIEDALCLLRQQLREAKKEYNQFFGVKDPDEQKGISA